MIAKISKGTSFSGLLKYLGKVEEYEIEIPDLQSDVQPIAEIIGGNMYGRNPQELAREFRFSRQLNANCKKPVFHVSLTLPLSEQLDKDTWNEVAEQYLERMGFTDNQYAIFEHRDTPYNHIHIIVSAIQLGNGKLVDDGWDHLRSMKITRSLEKEYGLQQVEQAIRPQQVDRALTKQVKRQQKEYESGKRATPPEIPVKFQLQQQIEKAATDQPTMSEFVERLMVAGIDVQHQTTRTGKSKGISYELKGVACSGTKLGGAYTWNGLQQYLKVDYQATRDEPKIQQLSKLGVQEVQRQHYQGLSEQQNQWIKQRTELLSQQLIELTAQEEIADRYRAVDLEELREWYRQAETSGKSSEYLSRIGEIGQTLRDWQNNSSVGWEKVQKLNLDDIQQQMAIDREEYQKSLIAPEKAKTKKSEVKVKVKSVSKKSQFRGMQL